MRISDWSSDVCSSDLVFARSAQRGRSTVSTRLPAIPTTCGWGCDHGEGPPPAVPSQAGFRPVRGVGREARRQQVDRKSVGKGKSVTVRVDLGGRSIIKKKTKKHK